CARKSANGAIVWRSAFPARTPRSLILKRAWTSTCRSSRAAFCSARRADGTIASTNWLQASHRRIDMAKRIGAKPPGARSGRREYVPDVGDLVWFSFSPQAGREQAGRRPGVVLSPRSYNSSARLCIVCPVTSHAKGYPFEVPLPADAAITGVVLADHVRSA